MPKDPGPEAQGSGGEEGHNLETGPQKVPPILGSTSVSKRGSKNGALFCIPFRALFGAPLGSLGEHSGADGSPRGSKKGYNISGQFGRTL